MPFLPSSCSWRGRPSARRPRSRSAGRPRCTSARFPAARAACSPSSASSRRRGSSSSSGSRSRCSSVRFSTRWASSVGTSRCRRSPFPAGLRGRRDAADRRRAGRLVRLPAGSGRRRLAPARAGELSGDLHARPLRAPDGAVHARSCSSSAGARSASSSRFRSSCATSDDDDLSTRCGGRCHSIGIETRRCGRPPGRRPGRCVPWRSPSGISSAPSSGVNRWTWRPTGSRSTPTPRTSRSSAPRASAHRVRAAIERELALTDAYLTWNEEAQRLEDALRDVDQATNGDLDALRRGGSTSIQVKIDRAHLNSEEWNVLYRERLQVEERAARRRSERGGACVGCADGTAPPASASESRSSSPS